MPATHSLLHPVRWAAVLALAIPLFLLAAGTLASLSRHLDAARWFRHGLRYTLFIELSLLLLLAVSGAIYERASQVRDLRLSPPPGRLIDVNGYRLHLYCTGEGSPTVVLEHGLDGSYLDWRLVQPEVARFTRVCSYDRAGYGWSDRSPRPRVPSAMAEELHTLLKNAGEKAPFILVGHSMGAFDAIMYAHRYREEVSAIVLVDGTHPDESLRFSWQQKAWLRFLQFTSPLGLPRWRKWCGGNDEALRPLRAAVNCKARVFQTHYEQWQAFPDAAAEIRNLQSSLSIPLVVISQDPARGGNTVAQQRWAQLQKKLLRFSSDSNQVIAEGSGHAIPAQRPDVIVDVVRRLVEKQKPVAKS